MDKKRLEMKKVRITERQTINNINSERIITTGGNINLPDFMSSGLNGGSVNDIYDNVFIMYHRTSDNYPLMVKPYKWAALQNAGEIADGVVVVEGGKVLVVAPTQASTMLLWSNSNASGGGFNTMDRIAVINDWAGKDNTAAQIAASTPSFVTNTDSYAPGFCNLYSRANANGRGLTAGRWWLPSIGELLMIYANMRKINYALSLISNSDRLAELWYWSSTEGDSAVSWTLSLGRGDLGRNAKSTYRLNVRPVSAFYQ